MVRIRLSRRGKKKTPFYRIVITDIRTKRDGSPIELLGTYDPISKKLNLNKERAEYWVKKGAKPTETVLTLLKKQV